MGMIQGYISVNKETIDALTSVKNYKEKRTILRGAIESTDIDKTWQFLQYLLTGELYGFDHFIGSLFLPTNSTIEITEEEYIYTEEGKDLVRINEIENKIELDSSYLTPIEVKNIYNYLQQLSIGDLFDNCDFNEVNRLNIYPRNWDVSEGHKNYLLVNYNKLFDFLERSINSKSYVIVECG